MAASTSTSLTVLLIFTLLTTSMAFSVMEPFSFALPDWLKGGRRWPTRIRVYLQDQNNGANATSYHVVKAPHGDFTFGDLQVFQNILTVGPEPSSREIGRFEGFSAGVSIVDPVILLVNNFVFTAGKYKGSSILMIGRNPFTTEDVRELPIIGGTGNFRGARGYVLTRTYSYDDATANGVFQYDIFLY